MFLFLVYLISDLLVPTLKTKMFFLIKNNSQRVLKQEL